ncbi:MAG: hypothetical protein L0229_27760 [Blastocatellia bacterium]|nr:hypothetical protein [Blastocatellia bacterium]
MAEETDSLEQEFDTERVNRPAGGVADDETDTLEQEFDALAEQWRRETLSMSSSADIVLHPAYYQIIGMGRVALPWIFRELKLRGGHWFLALRAITRENPVKPEDRGKIKKMTEAWLQWGEEHGFLDI